MKRIPDQRDRSPVGWVCAAVTILTVAVPAWLIAQDAANTTTAPRGFGAFTIDLDKDVAYFYLQNSEVLRRDAQAICVKSASRNPNVK